MTSTAPGSPESPSEAPSPEDLLVLRQAILASSLEALADPSRASRYHAAALENVERVDTGTAGRETAGAGATRGDTAGAATGAEGDAPRTAT